MARARKRRKYRRVLIGNHTYDGTCYLKGELVLFKNFEKECPDAFKYKFSEAVDKNGRPVGSGRVRRRKA